MNFEVDVLLSAFFEVPRASPYAGISGSRRRRRPPHQPGKATLSNRPLPAPDKLDYAREYAINEFHKTMFPRFM